jgi:hypothetical protein
MKNLLLAVLCSITLLAVAADLWTRSSLIAHAQSNGPVHIETVQMNTSSRETYAGRPNVVGFSCYEQTCFVASK